MHVTEPPVKRQRVLAHRPTTRSEICAGHAADVLRYTKESPPETFTAYAEAQTSYLVAKEIQEEEELIEMLPPFQDLVELELDEELKKANEKFLLWANEEFFV